MLTLIESSDYDHHDQIINYLNFKSDKYGTDTLMDSSLNLLLLTLVINVVSYKIVDYNTA